MKYKNFSFIFFGDTHGYINDIIEIKRLLDEVEPDFVLAEGLQNISLTSRQQYNTFIKKISYGRNPDFNSLKEIIVYCNLKEIKLIGIDLKDFGFSTRLKKIVEGKIKSLDKDREKLSEILKIRERLHIRKIKEFSKLSNRPLVIIIGAWHLRERSILMRSFNNYLVMYPCDKNKKPIYAPKNKNINYCIKIKNG